VILFTGVVSSVYLGRTQQPHHWFSMLVIFLGVLLVGVASMYTTSAHADTSTAANPLLGGAFVVISQMFTALQMCVEERFVNGYHAPALAVVGWEGVWGACAVAMLLLLLQQLRLFEDTNAALAQIQHEPRILGFMLANAASIVCIARYIEDRPPRLRLSRPLP
jgi:drug/metabolite transporter (DMT)-like permease